MKKTLLTVLMLMSTSVSAYAEKVGEISVTTRWAGLFNDKIITEAFNDPSIPTVTCYVTYPQIGGATGAAGLAENPSRFSVSCVSARDQQICPTKRLVQNELVWSKNASLFFKDFEMRRQTHNNNVIYVLTSTALFSGSLYNANNALSLSPNCPQVK